MKMQEWISEHVTPNDWALVTGSSSGIGYEYTRTLAAMGCNILCLSNQPDRMERNKKELESAFGVKVHNINVDLRNVTETKRIAEDVAQHPIRILINNAGFGLKGPFESHSIDEYVDIITVNAVSPVIFLRAVLPNMQREGKGIVIHISSINSLVPIPNNQIYTATKAFCSNFASAVAHENKSTRILFQLVLPGTTRTPFHDRQGAIPKKMVMEPEGVVKASFSDITKSVCIPNPADRVLPMVARILPRTVAMDFADYLLKKRLKV